MYSKREAYEVHVRYMELIQRKLEGVVGGGRVVSFSPPTLVPARYRKCATAYVSRMTGLDLIDYNYPGCWEDVDSHPSMWRGAARELTAAQYGNFHAVLEKIACRETYGSADNIYYLSRLPSIACEIMVPEIFATELSSLHFLALSVNLSENLLKVYDGHKMIRHREIVAILTAIQEMRDKYFPDGVPTSVSMTRLVIPTAKSIVMYSPKDFKLSLNKNDSADMTSIPGFRLATAIHMGVRPDRKFIEAFRLAVSTYHV